MTEPTSDDARDDFVLRERLLGRSARSIGKQLKLTFGEINKSLDRVLPQVDNSERLRQISLDLNRLEALLETFQKRAIEMKDNNAALVCIKICERKSMLLGLDQPSRIDVLQIRTEQAPDSYDQIEAALLRVARKRPAALTDGPPDDGEPSH